MKSLRLTPHIRIEERIIASPFGVPVRVRFAVATIDGVSRVRVLSVQPIAVAAIGGNVTHCPPTLCLAAPFTTTNFHALPSATSYRSPFVDSLFVFFTSQMTRAPSQQ